MNYRLFLLLVVFANSYIVIGQAEEFDVFPAQHHAENQKTVSLKQKIYVEPSGPSDKKVLTVFEEFCCM